MACASAKPPAEVNNQISRNAEKVGDVDLLEVGDQIIPQFHCLFHAMLFLMRRALISRRWSGPSVLILALASPSLSAAFVCH